jgi:uncharacterized damage-inducible protein DinB
MTDEKQVEAWLSGPVEGVPPLLQPVAHALLNASQQIHAAVEGLTPGEISSRPRGIASVGYHVRHAMGSLDRLFTYARGDGLSSEQRKALVAEGAGDDPDLNADDMTNAFDQAVEHALSQLRATDEATLLDHRGVGRAQLPSTVLGLLFHGGEHTARHAGQVVTTAKLVRGTE